MRKQTAFGIILAFVLLFGCTQPGNALGNSSGATANSSANASANDSAKEKQGGPGNPGSAIANSIAGESNGSPASSANSEAKPLVQESAKGEYWFCNFPSQVSNAESEYKESRGFIYRSSEYRDLSTYSVTFIPGLSNENSYSPLKFSGKPAIISKINPPDCIPAEIKSLKAGESFTLGNYTVQFKELLFPACENCDAPAVVVISSGSETYENYILPGMGFRQSFPNNDRIGLSVLQTYWLSQTEAVAEVGACQDDGGSVVINTDGHQPVKIVEGQEYCGLRAHLEWANLASWGEPDAIKTIAFVRK
ncbi:Uncharacterised protein [Candidatus Gugararchaeum adminiculabundum]|nr:Uncharacterised protein [Candidatus Gugararchaeum adminiculabundum]